MNRRELLQSVATAAAGGVVALDRASVVASHPAPVFAVLEYTGHLSTETAERLRAALTEAFKETPFEGVKAIVLDQGCKLTFLDRSGRVCNERIDAPEESDM